MRAIWLIALLATPALSGCAELTGSRACDPLVFQHYPEEIGPTDSIHVSVFFTNCGRETVRVLGDPCDHGHARGALAPTLRVDNETYVIGHNRSAVHITQLPCDAWAELLDPGVVEPRYWVQFGGAWDGTLLDAPDGDPRRVEPGTYWLHVEVNGHMRSNPAVVRP